MGDEIRKAREPNESLCAEMVAECLQGSREKQRTWFEAVNAVCDTQNVFQSSTAELWNAIAALTSVMTAD